MPEDKPIEPEVEFTMNAVAESLTEIFPGMGIALLVFSIKEGDNTMNYISNANREDMITALEEFIRHSKETINKTKPIKKEH